MKTKLFLTLFLSVIVIGFGTFFFGTSAFAAAGDSVVKSGLLYTLLPDGTYEVGQNPSGTKPSGSITIPATVNGKKVTRIASAGFADCTSLTKITLPDSVIYAGENAFQNTALLANQSGTVKYAGKIAVWCSENAVSIKIADGTLGLADKLCFLSEDLQSVTLPKSLLNTGAMTFNECTKLTSVTIPDNVKTIGSGAFAGCISLSTVTLPSSLTEIGAYAFYRTDIASITIPDSVKTIGKGAFERSEISSNGLKIGTGYINIGGRAFVSTPFYNSQSGLKYAGNVLIGYSGNITSAEIKSGTTAIADLAFANCATLSSVTIPKTVKRIGEDAFFACSSLTSVTVPQGVQSIGEDAFRLCEKLTAISLPKSLKTIDIGAFYGCSALKKVNYAGSAADWANVSVKSENTQFLSVIPTAAQEPKVPAQVTGLKASRNTTQITLSWNKCDIATHYQVDIYQNGKWTALSKFAADTTSYTVTGLSQNTSYQFRVFAFTKNIYSSAAKITAKTLRPAVSGLKADASATKVSLSWTQKASAEKYQVYVYKNGAWTSAGTTSASVNTYTVTGLSAKTAYTFRVAYYVGSERSAYATVKATTLQYDPPAAVTNLKASPAVNSVSLSWSKSARAELYKVYVLQSGKWKGLASVTTTSYTAKNLDPATKYQFRVYAFKADCGSTAAAVTTTTKPAAVTNLKAASTASAVKIAFKASSGADSYQIDVKKNGVWTYCAKTAATSCTVKNLSANTIYEFRVFAFKGSTYSAAAHISAGTLSKVGKPAQVSGITSSAGANSVTLSWDKNSVADSYQVSILSGGKWKKLTKTTATSYTATGLNPATTYQFALYAFKGSTYSAKTTAVASTKPATVTNLKAVSTASAVKITFKASSGADSYQIDMKKNGAWVRCAKSSATSCTVKNLSANTVYEFRVFAFKGSTYSTAAHIKAGTATKTGKPAQVSGITSSSAENSITLSWDKNYAADSYQVSVLSGGKWKKLTKTTATSYKASGLTAGTTYTFALYSFKGDANSAAVKVDVSTKQAANVTPSKVSGVKTSMTSNAVTFTWTKDPAADSYQINILRGDSWVKLAKVTGNTYTASGLDANTSYTFALYAFSGSVHSAALKVTATTSKAAETSVEITATEPKTAASSASKMTFTGDVKMMRGIDVCGYQGEIDFNKVKAAGIDFVIIKAGYYTSTVDTWEKNYANARKAGLKVGAYWYSYATTLEEGKNEANAFLKAMKGKKFEFPVYFDLEEEDQFAQGKEFCTQLVETFCGTLENAGYCAGVYSSTWWYTNYVDEGVRLKRPNWIADYRGRCYYEGKYGVWQYSDAGVIDGVQYVCDLDIGYVDYSAYIRAQHLNGC